MTNQNNMWDRYVASETGINWSGSQAGHVGVMDFEMKKKKEAADDARWREAMSGSSSGSSSSNKVICTELRRQNLFTAEDHRLCADDAAKRLTDAHFRGYHLWGLTVVRLMRKKPGVTTFFRGLAQARVDEIAARNGQTERANLLGKVLIGIGEPACAILGRFCVERDYKTLYQTTPAQK